MTKKIDKAIVIAAIVCITGLECVAMSKGIDGTAFSLAVAIIAGLAGFVMPSPVSTK